MKKSVIGVGAVISFLSVLLSADSASIIDASAGVGSTASTILTIIYVLFASRLPIDQQFVLIALAIPNTKALNIMGVSGAVCVCAVSALVNGSRKSISKVVLFLSLVFIFYSFQYILRFSDFTLGISRPVKTAMNLAFFSMMSRDREVLLHSSAIGYKGAIGLFWGIVSAALATVIKNGFLGRFAIVGNDPNILAIECATAMAIFSLCFFEYKYLSEIRFAFYFFTMGLVILLGASRMGLFLFAFVIVSTVLLNPRKFGKSSLLLILLALGLVAFLASTIGKNALDAFLMKQYSLELRDDFSNGRLDYWKNYIIEFNSNPMLWWIGMGDYRYYGLSNQAHNFLIEDIANYGIIGLSLLYLAYFIVYRSTHRNSSILVGGKTKIYQVIPFLVPLVGGVTLHGLTNVIDTTLFFMGALCMTRSNVAV